MEEKKKMEFYGGTLGACLPLISFMAIMILIAAMKKVSLVLFCMAGFAGLCIAFLLVKNKKEFENAAIEGIQNKTLCTIVFAYLLAGVLSQELRQSGLINGLIWAMTGIGLKAGFLPLIAFLACCLISVSCGTSNGAIVAVMPIVLPAGAAVGANPAVIIGAVISGAIFGDNLAPISDTTIASAITQEAEVRDVVRTRLPYALIAALVSAILFIIVGLRTADSSVLPEVADASSAPTLIMLTVPVVMVFLMLKGLGLIGTLLVCDILGFLFILIFGFVDKSVLFSAGGPIGAGLTGMLNVICFSFFMFALLEMLNRSGIFGMLMKKIAKHASTPQKAEWLTALIEVVAGFAIGAANISILFVGPVARSILKQHNIEKTRGANIIDGFGTAFMGIVPYNSVALNAVSLAIASGVVAEGFSFLNYLPYLFHSYMLIILFSLSIITGIGRRFDSNQKTQS